MMANNRTLRIAKELTDIQKDSQFRIILLSAGSDEELSHLKISLPGPFGSQYDGGRLLVNIEIPKEYPFRWPTMKFKGRIKHPIVNHNTVYTSLKP